MATSVCSREKHSEEILEFVCSPCLLKDKTRKADKFCETCNKYYCAKCLAHHNEIFIDHRQLGEEDFEGRPAVLLPTERCGIHGNELLQMFCKDHDKVLCNTCVSVSHRFCSNVVFIPSEVQNLMKPMGTVKTELSTALASLTSDEASGEKKHRRLSHEKDTILKSLECHGLMLKAIIDKMVEKSKQEVEEKHIQTKNQLQRELEKIHTFKKELEQSVRQLDIAEKQNNESQMFVLMKKCKSRMTESKKHHAEFTAWCRTIKLEYGLTKTIEMNLKKFKSLGCVIDTLPYLYGVIGQNTLKACRYEKSCLIAGSCKLPDGSFLVTDSSHKMIVQIDSACSTIIDKLPLPGYPYAVCLIKDTGAAVSLHNQQTIEIISLGRRMRLTTSWKLPHICRGLAFSQGELFVSDGGSQVHVYDTTGNILRTLGTSTLGQGTNTSGQGTSAPRQGTSAPGQGNCDKEQGTSTSGPENSAPGEGSVFKGTDHIAVSPDGKRLYVADRNQGLVCVDRYGKELFTFKDSQLQYARGVCTDNRGSVFVCGYESCNVLQLSEEGMLIGQVLQQSMVTQKPVSVCFDSVNKRLLLTKGNDSKISVISLCIANTEGESLV